MYMYMCIYIYIHMRFVPVVRTLIEFGADAKAAVEDHTVRHARTRTNATRYVICHRNNNMSIYVI